MQGAGDSYWQKVVGAGSGVPKSTVGEMLDQGSVQDTFLQPQISNSSPVRRRGKGHGSQEAVAGSADLADLLRRCEASEQQLAAAKRALLKEKQRNKQLRASCDALALSNLHLGQALEQVGLTTTQQGMLMTQQQVDSAPGLGTKQAGMHAGVSEPGQVPYFGIMQAANLPTSAPGTTAAGAGPCQQQQAAAPTPLTGLQAAWQRRWSTDTAVAADQGSSLNGAVTTTAVVNPPSPTSSASSAAAPSPVSTVGAAAESVVETARGHEAAATSASRDLDGSSLQTHEGATTVSTAPAGGQTLGDLQAAEEEAQAAGNSVKGATMAASPRDTSPVKRTAQQQPDATAAAQDGASSPSGSPDMFQKRAVLQPALTHSSKGNQVLAGAPTGPGPQHTNGAVLSKAGAAMTPGAVAGAGSSKALIPRQPYVLSKRPAMQYADFSADQPLIKAARKFRQGGSEPSAAAAAQPSNCSSCADSPQHDTRVDELNSSCSQALSGAAQDGLGGGADGDATEAAVNRVTTASAPGNAASANAADIAGSGSKAAAACSAGEGSTAACAAERQPSQGCSVGSEGSSSSSSAQPAVAASQPAAVAGSSSSSNGLYHPAGGLHSGANRDSSTYRRSRLSSASGSTSLALVPVPAQRNSSCAHQAGQGGSGSRTENIQGTPSSGMEQSPDSQTGQQSQGHSQNQDGSSYSRRAAKAAKAVAKKLRKLFIGISSGSGTAAQGASAAGATGSGSSGSSSSSSNADDSGRDRRACDSEFRRSWQGPFFSSTGAAKAAAAQGSRHKGRQWRPPKWARKYGGYSSDSSSSAGEDDGMFDDDPFGPSFSPLRHNFRQRHPQQQPGGAAAAAAAGEGDSPFLDPFGPAFSPLRQSMRYSSGAQQGGQQQGRRPQPATGAAAAAQGDGGDEGFGPDWVGID